MEVERSIGSAEWPKQTVLDKLREEVTGKLWGKGVISKRSKRE